MNELLVLNDEQTRATAAWAKAIAIAALLLWLLFCCLDAGDALANSSPRYAAAEWARHAFGEPLEGEREAKALLAWASVEAGLPTMARARVWTSDRMGAGNVDGLFNPLVFKITLGRQYAEATNYQQRWVVLHEAGHVAQALTLRLAPAAMPQWGLSDGAERALADSLLYQQAFSESFADLFALAMALRLDRSDSQARLEAKLALDRRLTSVSIAHDTQAAMRLGLARIDDLASWRGPRLLALIDALASRGAALSVGEWGAEREALCLRGAWGWSRWARDSGHEMASNPWRMAPAAPAADGEPMARELGELMALSGPGRGWKRARAESLYADSYRERKAQLEREGAGAPEPEQFGWGVALADFELSSRNPARELLAGPLGLLARAASAERPWGCQ